MMLLLHLDPKRIERQAESTVRVTLLNTTPRTVQVYGFWESPAGGPDLGIYLEFVVLRRVDGNKVPIATTRHRTLPPIDDLYGRVYDLPPGQEWSQRISGWLPRPEGKSLPPGSYDVTAEFDDAMVVSIISNPDSPGIGRIDSPPAEFDIVGE